VGDRVARLDVEDLGRAVAASGDVAAVETEAHTADDTLVGQVVDEVDVEDAAGAGVEDGEPVGALLLEVFGQLLDFEIGEDVALAERDVAGGHEGALLLLLVRRRRGTGDLGRAGVRRRVVLLGSSRAARRAARGRALAAGGGSGLGRLRVALSCRVSSVGIACGRRKLTVGGRAGLLVTAKVLGRARSGIQARRALGTEMGRHALLLLGLLRGRGEARAALGSAAGHDAAEEVAGAVANLRGLGLGRAVVLAVLGGAAALLEFALELGDAVLILCLHLVVLLLERVDAGADQLNLLDVAGDCRRQLGPVGVRIAAAYSGPRTRRCAATRPRTRCGCCRAAH
jgi:hypothetical protein